jgi:TorA maturation chaperone TorD
MHHERGWEVADRNSKTPDHLVALEEAASALEELLVRLTPAELELLEAAVFSKWGDKALAKWADNQGCTVAAAIYRLNKLKGRLQWELIQKGFNYAN